MREYSHSITKKQYDYLLPVFGIASGNNKLMRRTLGGNDFHYFIGTNDAHKDMLNRCKYLD